jgi:hypothetical protein
MRFSFAGTGEKGIGIQAPSLLRSDPPCEGG